MGAPRPGLPAHVAIIMDGNGRWARARGLPRVLGHRRGARTVREIVTAAREIGIRHLTLFAFSSENWGRPRAEVDALMDLLSRFLVDERPTLVRHGIALRAIGDRTRLPPAPRGRLEETERLTASGAHMRLTLALSYGGRDEIVRAARALATEAARDGLDPRTIDDATFASRLDTHDLPDPDLVIRTGGERRLSNFLLWQAAYAELWFTDTRWPAFSRIELERILAWYRGRRRRFGRLDEQVA